jgi:HAAS
MAQTTDDLIRSYLDELEAGLAELPREARREVVAEISAHIAELRTELDGNSEAEMRRLLERVGDPADIAADARERFGIQARKRTWIEVTALLLLSVGSLVAPVVGWLAGVVLLWMSDVWSTRDKVLGTLVVPGGIGSLWLFAQTLGGSEHRCPNGTCSAGGSDFWPVVFLLLALASVATTVYLGVKLRRLTRRAVLA